LTKIADIQVPAFDIALDSANNKIYATNKYNNTISVINSSNYKIIHNIDLGKLPVSGLEYSKHPSLIEINRSMRVIYVANRASHTISVINGFSDKVAAGVRFKVNPVNSGTIICDNQSGTNQNEYPTNVYIYIDNATKCTGQGNGNFGFDRWTQDLSRNSSFTINDPSGDASKYLTIDRYGNFTAYFTSRVLIPSDFLYGVVLGPTVGAILGGVLGWYIPYIMNKRTTKKDTSVVE
jgi:YVTN family beta-propeller protein